MYHPRTLSRKNLTLFLMIIYWIVLLVSHIKINWTGYFQVDRFIHCSNPKLSNNFFFVTSTKELVKKPSISKKINTNKIFNNQLADYTSESHRVQIKGSRYIVPGDYVVHEDYGIGKYIGIREVDITPGRDTTRHEPTVVVKYLEGEISWFKRVVDKELWLYRTAESGEQEVSSLLDYKKWIRRKKIATERSKSMAMNLIQMMAIRNGIHRTPCLLDDPSYIEFEKRFQFEATPDQNECFKAIEYDMVNSTRPMDRLICGDVGFGKTEVAMRAIYRAVASSKQVAFLVPTRVLALQHLRVLKLRMPEVNVQLLRGGNKADAQTIKDDLKKGVCQVAIGTHAILQPNITFDNLGLLVIDEEQRFGVAHKEKLKSVSSGTDVLTLSATPIPRTLQMSLSGLRDFSKMNSPPKGRLEVKVHVGFNNHSIIQQAISYEVSREGQVFVVVPFIQDILPTKLMIKELLPNLKIIEAHGQLDDLEDRIDQFINKKAEVLIATTVIENGIDMPNVNTIIVFSADRFGMSSLYQLRGRVGRSTKQAYAFFMTNSSSISVDAESRLIYLKTFTALGSGYDLSRRDMEMRGFGTIFGEQQSGSGDIGFDLQTSILNTELDCIKKNYILTVPDTRIEFNDIVEEFGENTNNKLPLPSDDLSIISRWEAAISKSIIGQEFFSMKRYQRDATRKLLSANNRDKLANLFDEWENKYQQIVKANKKPSKFQTSELPQILINLLDRAMVRIYSRSIGISEILLLENFENNYIKVSINMKSTQINSKKWKSIESSIPKEYQGKVTFTSSDSTGIISYSTKILNNFKEKFYLKEIYQDIIFILESLYFEVEKQLNQAINATNTATII
eukprot:gene10616-14257_t